MPNDRPRCRATTRQGKPCPYRAKEGSEYCGHHLPKNILRRRIKEYFAIEAEKLLADVTASATLTPHTTTQGDAGEEKVRAFLRHHLPIRYGVGSGHVVSFLQTSAQTDIVIYDHFDCFTIPITETTHLYSLEGVYAAIEVKGSPTRQAVNRMAEAVENITSIKSLVGMTHRFSRDPELSLRTRPFDVPVLQNQRKGRLPKLPIGAILILQCSSRFETVIKHYREELCKTEHWHKECDLFCVLDKKHYGICGSDVVMENDRPVRKYWQAKCDSLGETLTSFLYWLAHKMYFDTYTEFPVLYREAKKSEERWTVWPTVLAPVIPRIYVDHSGSETSWPWFKSTRQFED